MNSLQKNYCPTRRELLAVIASLQHFRHYLLGSHIFLRTDHHSLKWLKTFKRPEGILARWIETLAEFDYEIEHRPWRLHCNADGVSRPICKQCWGKSFTTPWIDEFERADELIAPLETLTLEPELSIDEVKSLQSDDPAIASILDLLAQDISPDKNQLRSLPLETRNLWSQRPLIRCQDGILVREIENCTQLVVPFTVHSFTFDLFSGFWQLGMTNRAKEASPFCTRRGLFHFTRMPFGLAGAPATFCRLVSIVLREQLWKICLCYLDDVIVFARTPQELLDRLDQVLTRLHEIGLKIKPSKSVLFKTEVDFLGHVVTHQCLTN